MFSLYVHDAGQDRFDVIRLLTAEYGVSLADAKMILCGMKTKILEGDVAQLRLLQEKLEALGAETVIEIYTKETDDESP